MIACRRCGTDATNGVEPYWARDGHRLCTDCAVFVAGELDRLDRWPPVPWGDDDRAPEHWNEEIF